MGKEKPLRERRGFHGRISSHDYQDPETEVQPRPGQGGDVAAREEHQDLQLQLSLLRQVEPR